jgi:hypothetical protein
MTSLMDRIREFGRDRSPRLVFDLARSALRRDPLPQRSRRMAGSPKGSGPTSRSTRRGA